MHYEQPYYISHPPPQPSRRIRSGGVQQNTTLRYCLFGFFGVCCLLVIITLITLFVVYFIRYQNSISSYLSYPDFTCSQRPCGCPNYLSGKSSNGKVVGGKEALPYTYPWLIALVNRETTDSFCSGFIVSSNAILTAAHCIQGRNPYLVQILAKVHDLRQFNGERYDIDQWFIHPEYRYNDSMHLNDIAVIKIKNSFAYDLRSCCLPSMPSSIYPREKTKAVISGWGKLTTNSPVLQHAVLPIVDERNIRCRETIIDTNRQLCAGYTNRVVDSCSGDSGGPLLIVEYDDRNQGHFVAAGIVNYENRQYDPSVSSGVYTRVGFYLPWIQEILSNV